MDYHHRDSTSLANKLKSSIIFCASSCCNDNEEQQHEDESSKVLESSPRDILETSRRSLSKWIISQLCASIVSMIKIGKSKNRHRGNTAEFRYDPLSYALNFEDYDSHIDEFPLRDFSARLPSSPKKTNNGVVSKDITLNAAWS